VKSYSGLDTPTTWWPRRSIDDLVAAAAAARQGFRPRRCSTTRRPAGAGCCPTARLGPGAVANGIIVQERPDRAQARRRPGGPVPRHCRRMTRTALYSGTAGTPGHRRGATSFTRRRRTVRAVRRTDGSVTPLSPRSPARPGTETGHAVSGDRRGVASPLSPGAAQPRGRCVGRETATSGRWTADGGRGHHGAPAARRGCRSPLLPHRGRRPETDDFAGAASVHSGARWPAAANDWVTPHARPGTWCHGGRSPGRCPARAGGPGGSGSSGRRSRRRWRYAPDPLPADGGITRTTNRNW